MTIGKQSRKKPVTLVLLSVALRSMGLTFVQVGAFTRKGNGTLSKGYMLRTDEDGTY